MNDGPWIIERAGDILARFETEDEAREATLTGEYPEDAVIGYVGNPVGED